MWLSRTLASFGFETCLRRVAAVLLVRPQWGLLGFLGVYGGVFGVSYGRLGESGGRGPPFEIQEIHLVHGIQRLRGLLRDPWTSWDSMAWSDTQPLGVYSPGCGKSFY